MSTVWLNGTLLDEADATLPALDRGVVWGWGVFETLRAYGGTLWAVREHHERLSRGAAVLHMAAPSCPAMRAAMEAVMEANGLRDCGVRITLTAGAGPADPHGDPESAPNALVTAWPLRDYGTLYRDGAVLLTGPASGRALAEVKTISYAISIAGRLRAREAGADDVLFVDADDVVLETTGSNLLAVFGSELVGSPPGSGLLPGITRATVLESCEAAGLAAVERPVLLSELSSADEVVLTSTLREVYPVARIDDIQMPRNGHAERLRRAFRSRVGSLR